MKRTLLAIGVLLLALGAAYLLPPTREALEAEIPHLSVSIDPPVAHVLFGGDMMFDRSIRQYAAAQGGDYLFACLDPLFASVDLVVANLEGPITPEPSVSVGSVPGGAGNYTFTFPTSTAALLAQHHVGAVNLGNNHIYNFSAAGVRSTIAALDDAQVLYFGDPLDGAAANIDVAGVPLTLINYNEFLPPGEGTASSTLAQIAAARAQGRVPLVYTHWGVEYATSAPAYVVALAHKFVDAGAAAVIGSHPHVVEQSEIYNGAPVYYSLGNLIFDQYFSSEVTHGLMLELAVSPSGASVVREVPVALTPDRRTCPVGDAQGAL